MKFCGEKFSKQFYFVSFSLYNFSGHETEFFVLVQDCVHVLDPLGVNGAVKDEPLALVLGHGRKLAEVLGQDAVAPLVVLKVTVKLNWKES